jgi:hypothetical protein
MISRKPLARPSEIPVGCEVDAMPPTGTGWDFSRTPLYSPSAPAKRLPGPIQRKLKVGAIDDPLEHEADRVAGQVMGMPASDAVTISSRPQVSRQCDKCEEEDKLQKKETRPQAVACEVPTSVHETLRSAGQPLDMESQAFFEPRFGRDLRQVRIHADPRAAESAHSVYARAYTAGHHVVFGRDQYIPHTADGRHLLAHELTHVVQQEQGSPEQYGSKQLPIIDLSQRGDVEEIEAPGAENRVAKGQKAAISALPPRNTITLMREPEPTPSALNAPSRLSEEALKLRSTEIYEQAVGANLKQKGTPVTKSLLGQFRKQLTVGVLQGVKEGKIVTLVNGHNPAFEAFVKASLKPGEEYIESISAIPENVRTGKPRKTGLIDVHSEQVLAAEAKVRGITDAQVGTSNNACGVLCQSNLQENYPEVLHVNPAKAKPPVKTSVSPAKPPSPAEAVSPTEASASEPMGGTVADTEAQAAKSELSATTHEHGDLPTPSSGGIGGEPAVIEEQERSPRLGPTRITVPVSSHLTGMALQAITIWALYNLQQENAQKMATEKKLIDGQIERFINNKTNIIADRWINFELVYANFTTFMTVETFTWLPRQEGSQGVSSMGPPQDAIRYLGSGLTDAEISDHGVEDNKSISMAHTITEDGADVSVTMELITNSSLLLVDNAIVRARILERISEIDQEMARGPSALDNFSLQMARYDLLLKLQVFQS